MCTMPSALLGTKNVLLSIQNREIENLYITKLAAHNVLNRTFCGHRAC